jgi:hypothetical protein
VLEGGSDLHQNKFFSSLRDVELDDIANVWSFTREFLVDQDAFDPGIDFAYFLGHWRNDVPPGDRHRIVNPGFTFMTSDGPVVSAPPAPAGRLLGLCEGWIDLTEKRRRV